jgi:hypothetical protein
MASAAAERMRRKRERDKAAKVGVAEPLLFETPDWHLFLGRHTLPQRAGCQPNQIGRVILKELVGRAARTGHDE